jgi:exonuclease VII small subunit
MSDGPILAALARLEAGQTGLEARLTRLEAGQTALEAGQTALEAGQTALEAGQTGLQAQFDAGLARLEAGQARLEASHTRLRSELMARMDGMADQITEIHADIVVNFGAVDQARRVNDNTRDELRGLNDVVSRMMTLILRLQTDVSDLKSSR